MNFETDNNEEMLATIWLLATLSGKYNTNLLQVTNNSKSNIKKSVTQIDIVKTCRTIINLSQHLSLRKSSNLMFGTVLAFKRQCMWNWKEVNSCRMLIQRLGVNIQNGNAVTVSDIINKSIEIKLLKDDARFDISQGLLIEFQEENSNNNHNLNDNNKNLENDGFQKIHNDYGDTDSLELRLNIGNETQEKWDDPDLSFRFDVDGNVERIERIEKTEDYIDFSEQPFSIQPLLDNDEIHTTLTENININEFDVFPETASEPFQTEIEKNSAEYLPSPPVSEKKKNNNILTKRNRKRLIVDREISLSVADIKNIRDGYIHHEENILWERYNKEVELHIMNSKVKDLANMNRYQFKNDYINHGKSSIKNNKTENNNEAEKNSVNNSFENEYLNTRSHSRSSSVSSIEEARRAVVSKESDNIRNSSSFQFDFSQRGGNVQHEGDIAQLEISFIRQDSKTNDTGEDEEEEFGDTVTVQSVEDFYGELYTHGKNILKSMVSSRHEAACKFMYVLQLTTDGRVLVEQKGLFGDITIAIPE
jgi:hypothetical protein